VRKIVVLVGAATLAVSVPLAAGAMNLSSPTAPLARAQQVAPASMPSVTLPVPDLPPVPPELPPVPPLPVPPLPTPQTGNATTGVAQAAPAADGCQFTSARPSPPPPGGSTRTER